MNAIEQYLMHELAYPQSGPVVLAINAADKQRGFNGGFGLIAIDFMNVFIVASGCAHRFYSAYFERAMQTAHLCWWKDGTFEKELSVDEFKNRMRKF